MINFVFDARTAVSHFPGIGRYVSNLAKAMIPIAISEATCQDVIEAYHVDSDWITAIPLAPAPNFKPQSPTHLQRIQQLYNLPTHYALYLGINKPHKNLSNLIRAWQMVYQHLPNPPTLVIAGAWDARYPEVKSKPSIPTF